MADPNTDGRASAPSPHNAVALTSDRDSLGDFEPEQHGRQRQAPSPGESAPEVFKANADVDSGVLFASSTSKSKAARHRALLYVTVGLMITAAAGILLRTDPPLPAAATREPAIPALHRASEAVEATTGSQVDHDDQPAPATHSTTAVSIDPPPAVASTVAADTLSGWWSLTNRVESTSYEAYDQLNLGYRVRLEQRGTRITGEGSKWLENGQRLPAARQTPIVLEGTVDGDRIHLEFKERGAQRTSAGTLELQAVGRGTLRGSFVSDAADSQGSSHARRLDSAAAAR